MRQPNPEYQVSSKFEAGSTTHETHSLVHDAGEEVQRALGIIAGEAGSSERSTAVDEPASIASVEVIESPESVVLFEIGERTRALIMARRIRSEQEAA